MVFHFNKAHLADPSIPAWVVKAKGQSFYVKHLECNAPFSTKETPDNSHTKGSLKFRHVDVIIENGDAEIIPERGVFSMT